MKKEKAKIISSVSKIGLCSKFERIYFGDEFCQYKIPSLKDLNYLKRNSNGKKISLVFPYISEYYFHKIEKLLKFICANNAIFDEIVFNDWGFFYYIRKNYPALKLVMGRLLTKQKTDPFAKDIITNMQKPGALKQKVFIPKKVPKETLEYFGSIPVNSQIFHKFMIENNIVRIESDNLNWDMNVNLRKKIKISVYFPYVKISTTRYCGQLNMLKNNCIRQCEKSAVTLKKYRTKFNYIIKGNAVFFKNAKNSNMFFADRIVYND